MRMAKLLLVLAFLTFGACSALAQPFSVSFYYYDDGDNPPLREECDNPTSPAIADGDTIFIFWDSDSNGPSNNDPRPTLCDFPPSCEGGPAGTVNADYFLFNGVAWGLGAGYFIGDPEFNSVATLIEPPRFYFRVCLDGQHWVSSVFVLASGGQDYYLEGEDWTCVDSPCPSDLPPIPVSLNDLETRANAEVCMGIAVGQTTDRNVTSFDFTVTFDPDEVTTVAPYFDATGGIAAGWAFTTTPDNVAGTLNVTGSGAVLSGSGGLGCVKFLTNTNAQGGDVYNVDFTAFTFNEGDPEAQTSGGTITILQPVIQVSPQSVAFGGVVVGEPASENLTINNIGGSSCTVSAISIEAPFTYTTSATVPFDIIAGGSETVTVGFTPTATDEYSATLSITHTAQGSPSEVPVTGTGIQPAIEVDPTTLDFQEVTIDSSLTLPLTINNNGTATLTITNIENNLAVYTHDFVGTQNIEPENSIVVNVTFTPVDDQPASDILTITSNDPASPTSVTLVGQGTSVSSLPTGIPTEYYIAQNYPNPFNPTTTIQFGVPRNGQVTIKAYDVLGRQAAVLVNETLAVGNYQVSWNCSQCASGLYFVIMESRDFRSIIKATLLK